MNITQHFSKLASEAAEKGADASQLLTQRDRLFKDKVVPALVKRNANEAAIAEARSKWNSQTDQVMQSAGLLPKPGQSSKSFAKDKRAEKAVNEAVKTGSKMPIIKEIIKSTGETIGNLFGQGVGSTIEGAAGFVRDIGENEKGSVAARLADYGKNLREEYEGSASTYQKDLQAGKSGKGSQLAAGAIQSIPAMVFPFGAAKGVAAIASKVPAIAGKSAYIGMGAGVAAGHTQNYGEVRRSATQNLERDFPTWEKLQGNPLFEQNFNKYLDSGVSIDKARQQAHAETLDTLSEEAANKYGGMMTAIDFIAPSGAVLGSGILKNAPTSKIGKTLVGGDVDSALVKREMNQVPRTGMAKLIPDVSLPANKAAAKMVGKQALEEGLQGGIGEYGAQAASANIGGTPVDYGKVGQTVLEEGLIGGIMGGGMQSATGGSPTAQAKDAAKQLRNQTNQLRQEEANARKELADAMQLNNPAAVQSAQANLNNIGAEALKVKSAYDQYGIDTPYFVERFAAQYQPKQQAEQQVDPEVPPTPEAEQPQPAPQATEQPQPAPQATEQPQPAPQTPVNKGMANTTNLVMNSVAQGHITPEEAQAIQSNPVHNDVFSLAATGDQTAAYNVIMNAAALGTIDTAQAQQLIDSIPKYTQLGQPKKPTISGIVNDHVKQQIQSEPDDLFANATELHPDTLEPLQGAELGITNFGYQPDPQQGIIAEDPNLSDFDEGPVSIDSLSTENPPEVLEPVQPLPADPVQPVRKKPDLNKPKTFTNYIRANDYLKSNGLQDSHEIVRGEYGIATVQPKSPAPEADVNSDEAFDDLLNAVPPIETPAQNPVEPVQAADPATDFDSDEAFDEVLNAVPPSKEAAPAEPVQPTTSFADQIREAHLNNPNTKPQLIEDEIAKGRSRADVLKEVGDIVKNIGKAPEPVAPAQIEQKTDENGIQENNAPGTMKPGDIGRGSDGKPYLSRNAALRGLKNNNVKDTHEIVELAPSKFVLRAKAEAPAPQETGSPFQKYDEAANQYHYGVNENGVIFKPNGQETAYTVKEKDGRLRIEDVQSNLIFSGPATPKTLEDFFESYWYEKKKPAAQKEKSEKELTPEKVFKAFEDLGWKKHGPTLSHADVLPQHKVNVFEKEIVLKDKDEKGIVVNFSDIKNIDQYAKEYTAEAKKAKRDLEFEKNEKERKEREQKRKAHSDQHNAIIAAIADYVGKHDYLKGSTEADRGRLSIKGKRYDLGHRNGYWALIDNDLNDHKIDLSNEALSIEQSVGKSLKALFAKHYGHEAFKADTTDYDALSRQSNAAETVQEEAAPVQEETPEPAKKEKEPLTFEKFYNMRKDESQVKAINKILKPLVAEHKDVVSYYTSDEETFLSFKNGNEQDKWRLLKNGQEWVFIQDKNNSAPISEGIVTESVDKAVEAAFAYMLNRYKHPVNVHEFGLVLDEQGNVLNFETLEAAEQFIQDKQINTGFFYATKVGQTYEIHTAQYNSYERYRSSDERINSKFDVKNLPQPDIGRASDNAPFANEGAANIALRKKGLEDTHAVVRLAPSQFVLRDKSQVQDTSTTIDLSDPVKLVESLIAGGRKVFDSGEPIKQGHEVVFTYKGKSGYAHLGIDLQENDINEIVNKLDRRIVMSDPYLSGGSKNLGSNVSFKYKYGLRNSGVKKLVISPMKNGDIKITATVDSDSKKMTRLKLVEDTQEVPKAPEPEATATPEPTPAKDPLAFPLAKVEEAYGHAHLSPGNTAKSFKESFDKFIQAEIDEAQPLATTDEQKAALNEAIDWVKDNYINKALPPLLDAASATVSSARAGRNNFNSKQANQRGSALDKATDQFNAELERLKGYAKLKVLAARTPKQKQADAEAAAKAEQEKLEAEQAKQEAKIKAEQEAKANKKRASNANLGSPEGAEQMTAAEWRAKHKDSKSVIDGVRYVMKLVNGATSLVPVWITDEKGTAASTSKDPLQVGNTLTFSQDFDYATANKPYTIITSSKAKLTIEHEGGRLSIDRKILDIESAKNPDLYQVEVNQPAPKTKEETPAANSYESVRQSFDDVVSRLDDGDESLTLDDVKAAYKALMDNHDSLVADLSKQTKNQLLEKMHPYYAAMYKSYKKDELVNKWVNNIYRGMDFGSNGIVTISYGDKRTMAEIVRDKIEAATQEDLNKYLEERRQAVAERQKELEAAEAGMNDPKTLDDFRRINAKGDFKDFKEFYRSLTVPQQALYDELRSAETNEARMQEIERNKAYREASRPSQAVESTTEATLFAGKHTKKGTDIWTVALNGRVDGDAFNDYRSQAKGLGGYYSSYKGGGAVPGFIFDNEAAANEFLNLVTGDHEANSTDPEPEVIAIDPEAEVEVIETDAKRQADKLREKAQAIIERGEQNINRERKTNTAKRAGEAARAEEQANKAIFLGETLNRIADGIENGSVKYLARLGAMTQLSHLESLLQRASYDQQRETNSKEREINATTIAYAEYPQYKTWIDSFKDIRRDLKEANPRLAEKLEKAIDTRYHNAYARWLNETNEFGTENYVGQLARKTDGTPAVFKTNIKQAETLVKASNKRTGKDSFEVFKIKNGEYAVISSYATAIENESWKPTNSDKQMTLTNEFGHELYDALKKYKRKNPSYYMNWFIESMHESVSRMEKLGIHDPATFRAAMREYLGLRSKEKGNDPIKELERSMIGRSNDGLDFFPTPRNVVEQMIEMADLDSDMKVLEPSAGMGHIADVLKDHGIQPDVIELSGKRQELLKLKGYSVVGNDFLMFDPKNRAPNYGDVFKTADGKYQGIMRGSGSLGSNRVRLMREDNGQMITYFDREELELVKMNGVNYDRIIMNPPFSDRRDAAHIYHAFDLLADDGVMVAIAGEGVFFGKDKAAKEFQEWLDKVGAEITPLDAGTFNDPSLPVTTGVKARIIKISKADSKGKLFSRSENLNQAPEHTQDTPTGSTPDQVRAELVKRFGQDTIAQLEESGVLTIEQTYDEPGIEGFAENGRVTLIADAITPENIVPVFLHELGGHVGLQGVMKPAAYAVLMKEFNRLVKSGDPAALKAKDLAERESDAEVQQDEYLPYLITVAAQNQAKQGPVQKLINRVVSAIKAWAVDKLGLDLKLNANDVLALAERMIKKVPEHTPPTGPKGGNKAPSVDTPIDRSGQIETAAFKTWFKDSKVVDARGKPLVMYHGTPKSFSKFNTDESGALLGKGSYFTANMADAAAYAGSKAPMQTYLSIQNPYYVNSVMDKVPSRQELKNQGYDGVILLNEDKSIKWAVAHKPAQIKSATANTGTFDSSNPDIRYSRSSTANPQNMSRSKQRELLDKAAQTAFGQMSLRGAEGAKTLSNRGLKLFQTMLHKALQDKTGQFKKTFDLVQGKINHVTFASSKSMDVAPSILTQLEEGSDYIKEVKRVGRTLGHTLSGGKIDKAKVDKDLAKVGQLMFENTLMDNSERHTDKELRQLGFDEDQIKLYNEIRDAIDTSLDTFANTTFSNIYKHLGGTHEEVLELAGRDLDITDHYNEILKKIDALTKGKPEKAEARQAAIEAIDRVYKKANDLKDQGYVPLMRFGKYFVRIWNPTTGEVAYRQHFESESERNIFYRNYDKANIPAGFEIEQGQINELQHKLFQGVSPETVALFAKESGLPIGDAETAYIKYAVQNNHALKRLLKRQGIDGFDQDIKRVLASFVMSNARYSANQTYNPAIDESITNIQDPAYQEDAIRLRDYSLDTQEELAAVKNFAFVWYMGFSAMFGVVNLTQPLLQTFPYLMQYSKDHGTIWNAFKQAVKTWRKGTDAMDPKYKAHYERARKEGHLDPQNTWMMQGLERGKSGLGASTWQLISHASGLFAQASETVNRRTSLFAALDVAESMGQAKLEKLGFKDAYDFAIRTIQETQGIYNKGNRPRVSRGNIGSLIMMYKQFMIAYIEQMVRMQKSGLYGGEDDEFKKKMAGLVGFGVSRSVLTMLGILMAFSGTSGLPFMRDILDGIETAGGLIGKPVNTEREIQIALHDALGHEVGQAVNTALMDGIINLNPFVDVKGRMGMGDLIPATAYFSPTTSEYMKSSEISQVAGPIGGLVEKVKESVALAQIGAYGQAGVQLLPKAVTSMGQGAIAATTGDYRNMKTGVKTNDATILDGIIKTLDAQPASIAKEGRVRGYEMKDKATQDYINKRWKERYNEALESGNRDQLRDVKQQIRDYNKDNPRYPIKFNQKTAETNFKKSNQSWQEKRKTVKGLEWMSDYNPHLDEE
ncbi:TPA: PLxRFG domain-containing protein [Acinetobacter baumannii]